MKNTFYTNVQQIGNNIILRGISNGRPFKEKVAYKPYHFIKSKSHEAEYSNLAGESLARVDFDSIYDAKDFLKKYEDVQNVDVYGFKRNVEL